MRKILNIVKENLIGVGYMLLVIVAIGQLMNTTTLQLQNEKLRAEIARYREQEHIEDFVHLKRLTINTVAKNEQKWKDQKRLRERQELEVQVLKRMAKWMEIGKIDILEKYQQRMDDVLIKSQTFVKKKPNEEDIELLANIALMESSWR